MYIKDVTDLSICIGPRFSCLRYECIGLWKPKPIQIQAVTQQNVEKVKGCEYFLNALYIPCGQVMLVLEKASSDLCLSLWLIH